MKAFLITVSILLFVSLLATVVVWWWVTSSVSTPPSRIVSDGPAYVVNDTPNPSGGGEQTETVNEGGIPLRTLPLSAEQQSVIAKVGIDPETFIITPTMQDCAKEKLGAARFAEIIAGDAPGALEVVRLGLCLGVD